MRPATPLICAFIDEHKGTYGVAPICRALAIHGVQIAPRTYWACRSGAPSKRALWDAAITQILAGIYEPGAEGVSRLWTASTMAAMPVAVGVGGARVSIRQVAPATGGTAPANGRTDEAVDSVGSSSGLGGRPCSQQR